MPLSNNKRTLTGGRAAYTGKNAYASQGFENDQRQSKLGSLALLYLWGTQAIPTGFVDTVVQFNTNYASSSFNPIYTRGFLFNPTDYSLYCQTTATYRLDAAVRGTSLGPGNVLVVRVRIRRGLNEIQFADATCNTDGANTNDFTARVTGYIDIQSGDVITLVTSTNAAALTANGSSTSASAAGGVQENIQQTFLHLQQVDLL